MGRTRRDARGGVVYHALNRAVRGLTLFQAGPDYLAFEDVLAEALARVDVRLLAYCVMPTHWHMVLWPRRDGDLSRFVAWLTLTHTQRWQAAHETVGLGHLYQGRFRSFPVQSDGHFWAVCRYVERNPLRAGLVEQAQDWRWGSLWRRVCGTESQRAMLSRWPIESKRDWVQFVNEPQSQEELDALRASLARGSPYGSPGWQVETARRLGLTSTLRKRGRPRKKGS